LRELGLELLDPHCGLLDRRRLADRLPLLEVSRELRLLLLVLVGRKRRAAMMREGELLLQPPNLGRHRLVLRLELFVLSLEIWLL